MKSKLNSKLSFASDNYSTTSPNAREYRDVAELEQRHAAYGQDAWTDRAIAALREYFEYGNLEAYFVPTGTAANCLAISHVTTAGGGVACCDTAHLVTDERGAPERFVGGKLHLLRGQDGLLDPRQLPRLFDRADRHWARPECVSITLPSEFGTLYSLDSLNELRAMRKIYGFRTHLDGARFGNAVASLGVAPKDLTWLMDIDVMTFGVTKNGAPGGEVIVFFDPSLATGFNARIKTYGNMISKLTQITAPICGLLETGEYQRNAEHANRMAKMLARGIDRTLRNFGYEHRILFDVHANAVFVNLPESVHEELEQRSWVLYSFIASATRFMTSWSTSRDEIAELLQDLEGVLRDLAESRRSPVPMSDAGHPAAQSS